MDGVDLIVASAPWLIVASLALLVGAAIGYYTAARDLDAERAKARAEGYAEGVELTVASLRGECQRAATARLDTAARRGARAAIFDMTAANEQDTNDDR